MASLIQNATNQLFNIICFSKDRPFQLSQFLSSVYAHVKCGDEKISFIVNVLYTFTDKEGDNTSESYKESYDHVIKSYPNVNFIKEKNREDFSLQLEQMVNNTFGAINKNIYIIFAVDDVLFYQDISLNLISNVYDDAKNGSKLFSVHLKLNPNVTYCHPKNAKAARPTFFTSLNQTFENTINLAFFDRSEGTADWNYPFDLCCSIYRRTHIAAIMERIEAKFGKKGYSHPNLLEVNGNKVLKKGKKSATDENHKINFVKMYPLCACPTLPIMSVLTVNRVQDVFENAIYGTVNDANLLENQYVKNRNLLLNRVKYKRNFFPSVHIGELYLQETATNNSYDANDEEEFLSVIMCVYNGAKYLEQAVNSILCQTYTKFEFIIVNDGSIDETNGILNAYLKKDKRIVVIQNENNIGIARSLNVGIKRSKGKFIVRMDSDDIAHPERFWYQINAFKMNPTYDIIGTGIMKIYDNDYINTNDEKDDNHSLDTNIVPMKNRKIISNPTNHMLVNWSMFFFCSIAHPTIMLRRKVFFDDADEGILFKGYPEDSTFSCIEDYACWFEKIENSNCKVMNLGHILLGLRQHPNRISINKSNIQQEQSIKCAYGRILERIKPEVVSIEALKGLYFPSKIDNVEILKEAAKLLLALEKSFRNDNDIEFMSVEDDVTSRLGELATIGMAKYTSDAIAVWLQWMDRSKKIKARRQLKKKSNKKETGSDNDKSISGEGVSALLNLLGR